MKKNINDPTPSWSAVPCCVLSYQNDIRQHWVISMFSRVTSDKHVRLKNVRGLGTVRFFFLEPQKGRDARPCGTRAHDDGRSLDIDKSYLLARSWEESHDKACCDQVFVLYSFLCTWARAHHPSRHMSTLTFSHFEIVIPDGFSSLCKRRKPFRWSAALLHTSFQHTPICGHSHEHECEALASPAWRREVVRLKNLAPLLKRQTMTYRNTSSPRVTWARNAFNN